ncbi:hypothetical protein EVAR_17058_1 [Eumeta japonica]|uniref:Uncharacterized protein n=1 Tax=Eumeta variegata TaxID=151549 RepID=A0A4C1V4L8_EUMVA|nr:hypothetical protein EVAR_17058_1 [Eumeta japonica]
MGSPISPTAHVRAQTQLSKAVGQDALSTGAVWEELIELARTRNPCSRLTRAPAPVCPLLDKTRMCRYAEKDRVEILVKHLEEQFILHPASDSRKATFSRSLAASTSITLWTLYTLHINL